MNKYHLQSKVKSTGTAYLFFLLFGCHYLYLGKWFTQFLFWFTLGGLGIWLLIDLFTMPSKVEKHNYPLFQQMEAIDRREKEEFRQASH